MLDGRLREADGYVRARIAEQSLAPEPFPHALIESIFPDWLYEEMANQWPDHAYFDQKRPERKILDLGQGDGRYDDLPPEQRQFWDTLQNEIFHRAIGGALIEKYAPYIDQSLRSTVPGYRDGDWRSIPLEYERAGMMMQSPGFELKRHIDSPRYVIIYLLYCPADDGHEDEGTDLYALPKSLERPRRLKTFYPDSEAVAHLDPIPMPYRRNSMATFLVTPRSLHSVTIKRLHDRRIINCAVKVPQEIAERIAAG